MKDLGRKVKQTDSIELIKVLKEQIMLNTADYEKYKMYFGMMKKLGLTNEEKQKEIFKENGFKNERDFIEKRKEFYKDKSEYIHNDKIKFWENENEVLSEIQILCTTAIVNNVFDGEYK